MLKRNISLWLSIVVFFVSILMMVPLLRIFSFPPIRFIFLAIQGGSLALIGWWCFRKGKKMSLLLLTSFGFILFLIGFVFLYGYLRGFITFFYYGEFFYTQ